MEYTCRSSSSWTFWRNNRTNLPFYSGYTSDVGDIDSMSNNAIEILSNENLKKEFKAQAFENAKKYDIKKVIPLYEDVYKKAISNS